MSKGYSSLQQNPEAESRRVCREDRAEEEEDIEEEEDAAENPGRVRLINSDQVSLTNHTKRHRNQ